ncbi:hypothetical protein [Psychromicrobium lacuslunae]|uniref:Uncharacterized protein n=1 Tax=Psychromicrobium lacuslunae TaxID=1618207 RepID=A0A0D4C139_9MICC|nr:hypothetical protein [Psychromicrobium lacuslunae]AJT42407.1 hypothetical protein UM93_14520 [Psychromicrobium lacuslunae]
MSDNLRQALLRLILSVERDADDHAGQRTDDYNEGLDEGALGVIQELKRVLNAFPEPETTTEWATRDEQGTVRVYEDEAGARHIAEVTGEELITRQVGAWQKASK